MKRFATLTASLTLTLILAVSGFAAANANVIGGEKQTLKENRINRIVAQSEKPETEDNRQCFACRASHRDSAEKFFAS